MQQNFYNELLEIIKSDISSEEMLEKLENYHNSDIVDVLEQVDEETRLKVYKILGIDKTAELFAYYKDVEEYVAELDHEVVADLIESMDSNDAVDVLNELDEEEKDKITKEQEEENERLKATVFFNNWARATRKHFKK